jgi:hypothetical protein
VGLNIISSKILDGNGARAMLGSIHIPNSVSFENKKNTSTQMVATKKYLEKINQQGNKPRIMGENRT